MIKRQLSELNFDKIKKNYDDKDLFNEYLFIFREKMIFITKSRKFYKLCTNYKNDDYLYMDSNFYINLISQDLTNVIRAFEDEVQHLTLEVVPF